MRGSRWERERDRQPRKEACFWGLYADALSGGSGTGRTTFVNTLVEQSLLTHRTQALLQDQNNPHSPLDPELVQQAAAHANEETPIRIKPVNVELEEDGVRIALTIVDTPGFGDSIDNDSW